MPPPTPAPDPGTIEAWLAGDLPEAEAASLERYFDEHPDEVPTPSPEVLGIELPPPSTPDPDLSELVELVKTKHAPDLPAPSADAWKEVLTPSENLDILGTLGDYEVLEVIATGGMGILLKARDPELKRIAALKVLSPELATNATARERFLREARAAAKLEHENILPIYSVHAEAVPYFAMRYAGGGSLQEALDAGRTFEFERLKSITRQIAAALGSAHAVGIVHRDIKPGNILLDDASEQVWVCDFGIATSTDDPSLTYAGGIAGTPQFMSPEQAAGDELDGRSDLFSLGAVLYRCVTGENAFAGKTTATILQNVTSGETTGLPAPKTKLPKWFECLLANLLAKDQRDRPSDAEAVISAIDDEHSPRPKHTARRNRRLAIGSLAILGSIALCFGALQIPAVKSLANRALGARFEQAFTISGKLGAHSSLADVIAAAVDGDTIELPATGRIAIDKLELPAGKSLILRPADAEARPTLFTSISGAPGIIAKAPLHLVGIDFVLNPRESGDGIVIASGSAVTLKIEGCKFTSRREVNNRYNDTKSRCIDLTDGASVEITACEFDLEETNAVSIFNSDSTSKLQIRDTRMTAFFGVNQAETASLEGQIEIDIRGLSFTGESFFKCSNRSGMATTRCTVEDSEFQLVGPLCWIGTSDVAAVRNRLHWHGSGNRFPNGLAEVRIARTSHRGGTPNSLLPITDYGGIGAIVSKLIPKPIKGSVQIEGSNKRYPDLASAVAAAPAGSTLLLSGILDCGTELLSPTGGLHLRPAPGERPVLNATNPEQHAIFMFGNSTVRGIRFVRQQTSEFTQPVIGLKSDGADILIEDCEFLVTSTGPHDGANALSVTDVGTATIRRCVFTTAGGAGVSVNFVDPDTIPAEVKIEDCLFIGGTAIATYARTSNTSARIYARRCIAIGDQLFSKKLVGQIGAIHLDFEECVIDPQRQLIHLPGVAQEQLATHFVWAGERNHYTSGMHVLHAGSDFTPVAAENFEALGAIFSTEEIGSTEFPPIDRRSLSNSTNAAALRRAFPESLESRALVVLELLDRKSKN